MVGVAIAVSSLAAAAPLAAQLPAAPASSTERIRFGGYAAITLNRAADSSGVRIAEGNVAAIISGSLSSRLSYLGELDAVSSSRQNYAGRQDDRQFEIARLYVEANANDLLRLRVGRFLTPVGQWNEIHAEPLTWTAVRPLATYRSFAKYSTGALLAGQGAIAGRDAGYALWAAPHLGDEGFELDEQELQFRGAFGTRLAVEAVRGVWLGASAAMVRERRPRSSFDKDSLEAAGVPEDSIEALERDDDENRTRGLLGFDLTARLRGFELRAEGTWLQRGMVRPAERTAFVQLAAPLVSGLHAVGRVEQVSPLGGRDARIWMAGLHWRGPGGVIVKVERQEAGRAPRAVANGWFLSVSSLF